MRSLLLVLLLAVQSTPPGAQANGIIEGRVLRAATSEPIPGAQVALTRLNPNLPQTPEAQSAGRSAAAIGASLPPATLDAMLAPLAQRANVSPALLRPAYQGGLVTAADGRFSFKDLPPGTYTMEVKRDGFFGPRVGGYTSSSVDKTIVIEAGKPTPPLELFLIQGGTISGRVRDPQGMPVPGITVTANDVWYPGGRAAWNGQVSKPTNDRGEFRLFWLPPGEYFVGASSRTAPLWTPTHYPGVTDPALAGGIPMKDGGEITGIDIDLKNAEPRYRISGTAVNPLPGARTNPDGTVDRSVASFFLVPQVRGLTDGIIDPTIQNVLPAGSRPNNEFEIRNVKPGVYDLYISNADYVGNHFYTSRTAINVEKSDITGLSLTVSPGVTLEGQVVMDSATQQPLKMDGLRVGLSPTDSTPGIMGTVIGPRPVDADGKFHVENVPEARWTAGLTGLPEGAYVSDLRQGGASVFDAGFTLNQQPNPIQIVVSWAGGTVRGIVTKDKKPFANATVVLVPPTNRRTIKQLFRVVSTDVEGKFSITGIMPMAYTVFAWGDRPFREPWLNEAFVAKYQDRGKTMTITAGKIIDTDLDVIP